MGTFEMRLPGGDSSLPVQTLRLEVLEGTNAGFSRTAANETLTVGTATTNDVVLTDPAVSRFHLELTIGASGIRVHDVGSTNGTWLGNTRLEHGIVPAGTLLHIGRSTLRIGSAEPSSVELHRGGSLARLRGSSPAMRRLMAQVQRAAQSETSVLIHGESGTGKEVVARSLHELGPRARGPFITVDCGSLAPTLVASELFGHEKGAFTGADRMHQGAFERAAGGTIFLDELGELPAALQATLLGVLERRRFRRVGGKTELTTDVRVLGATHRDLRSDVNAGNFRLDLYYRLAVVVLQVPPLRERPEDISLLVEHFLRECGHAGTIDSVISQSTMREFEQYRWPGNVRELRNVVEATVAMGEPPVLQAQRSSTSSTSVFPPPIEDPITARLTLPYKQARASLLEDFEVRYLRNLLERCEGNVSRAAREAQMDRSHLIDLLQRHRLK